MSARPGAPALSPSDILAQLADLVHLVTGLPRDGVRPDLLLVDDLRIDSLSMVEILEGASQHFGVRVEDEDVKGFIRVGDLVDYLGARLNR